MTPIIYKPKLLIFDLDGTLLDSLLDLTHALNAALTDCHLPTHSAQSVRAMVGNGSLVLCQRAIHATHQDDKALIERVHERFLYHYQSSATAHSTTYTGVSDGLLALHQDGFVLALCTNKPSQFVPAIVQKYHWHFDSIVCGDTLPHKKPNPEPLLHICHTLQISPLDAIMIGDSKNDILAGKSANMPTLGVSYGYNHNEPIQNSQPDAIFDTFADLVAFLLQLPPKPCAAS